MINLSPSGLKMPKTELGMYGSNNLYQTSSKDIKTDVRFVPFIYPPWEKGILECMSCKNML